MSHPMSHVKSLWIFQCCQISRIIQETPDFGPYLPVSRLESDISWIIAKIVISLDSIVCVVCAIVNMERFPINSGMPL